LAIRESRCRCCGWIEWGRIGASTWIESISIKGGSERRGGEVAELVVFFYLKDWRSLHPTQTSIILTKGRGLIIKANEKREHRVILELQKVAFPFPYTLVVQEARQRSRTSSI
jgi:hypothetical protein